MATLAVTVIHAVIVSVDEARIGVVIRILMADFVEIGQAVEVQVSATVEIKVAIKCDQDDRIRGSGNHDDLEVVPSGFAAWLTVLPQNELSGLRIDLERDCTVVQGQPAT